MDKLVDVNPIEFTTDQNKNYVWQEITEEFIHRARELRLGELVRSKSFSLFDSMSAIELMDPKMDAGMNRECMHKEEGDYLRIIEEAFNENIIGDPHKFVTMLDYMFSLFVTWVDGDALETTIFTCVFINQYAFADIEERMRPEQFFAAGMLKLIALCRDAISQAMVFEEEDFVQTSFGFQFASQYSIKQILLFIDDYTTKLKTEPDVIMSSYSIEQLEAVRSRFTLLSSLIQLLKHFFIVDPGVYFGACHSKSEQDEKNKELPTSPVVEALCSKASSALKTVFETRPICSLYDASIENQQTINEYGNSDLVKQMPKIFMPDLYRHLMPSSFPRASRVYRPLYAYTYLRNVVSRLLLLHLKMPQNKNSYDSMLIFARTFSQTGSRLLERSLLQLVYLPVISTRDCYEKEERQCICAKIEKPVDDDDCEAILPLVHAAACPVLVSNQISVASMTIMNEPIDGPDSVTIAESIFENLRHFTYLPEWWENESSKQIRIKRSEKPIWTRERFDIFIHFCAQIMAQMIGNTGKNRERQRESIVDDVLPAIDTMLDTTNANLQYHTEAGQNEKAACDGAIINFLIYHALLALHDWLTLSIEMELFANHELSYVYWFVAEAIYRHLKQICGIELNTSMERLEKRDAAKDRKKGKHRRQQDKLKCIFNRPETPTYWLIMHQCSLAMYLATLAIRELGLEPVPRPEDEPIRFDQRFGGLRLFQFVRFKTYHQYRQEARSRMRNCAGVEKTLEHATNLFTECRKEIDSIKLLPQYELAGEQLDDMCKNNAVVCKLLQCSNMTENKRISYVYTSNLNFPKMRIISR